MAFAAYNCSESYGLLVLKACLEMDLTWFHPSILHDNHESTSRNIKSRFGYFIPFPYKFRYKKSYINHHAILHLTSHQPRHRQRLLRRPRSTQTRRHLHHHRHRRRHPVYLHACLQLHCRYQLTTSEMQRVSNGTTAEIYQTAEPSRLQIPG